jgi:hypothetical protein
VASKRKRKTADRDHRAISLKGARTRAKQALARGFTKPVETEHASRERFRARKLMEKVAAAWRAA